MLRSRPGPRLRLLLATAAFAWVVGTDFPLERALALASALAIVLFLPASPAWRSRPWQALATFGFYAALFAAGVGAGMALAAGPIESLELRGTLATLAGGAGLVVALAWPAWYGNRLAFGLCLVLLGLLTPAAQTLVGMEYPGPLDTLVARAALQLWVLLALGALTALYLGLLARARSAFAALALLLCAWTAAMACARLEVVADLPLGLAAAVLYATGGELVRQRQRRAGAVDFWVSTVAWGGWGLAIGSALTVVMQPAGQAFLAGLALAVLCRWLLVAVRAARGCPSSPQHQAYDRPTPTLTLTLTHRSRSWLLAQAGAARRFWSRGQAGSGWWPGWPGRRILDGLAIVGLAGLLAVGLALPTRAVMRATTLTAELAPLAAAGLLPERLLASFALHDAYLFAAQVPWRWPGANPAATVYGLRQDRFSYAESSRDEQLDAANRRCGVGLTLAEPEGRPGRAVAWVAAGSPAAAAGVVRGWRYLARDGIAAETLLAADRTATTPPACVAGEAASYRFLDPAGRPHTLRLTRQLFNREAPLVRELAGPAGPVLYLRLDGLGYWGDLMELAARLERARPAEMIVDLRYNGGGQVAVAGRLTALLLGRPHTGGRFARADYRPRYAYRDRVRRLPLDLASRGVGRITFIVGKSSCSAAEAVIVWTRQFLPVRLIGSTTCGKPWLMDSFSLHDWVLHPLTATSTGLDGDLWSAGLTPDLPAADDLRHAPGEPRERLTRLALSPWPR